jgi:dTDP-4-amino-4,6-dideoxygalactose transaminase
VIFESEQLMLHVKQYLADHGINTRRYFYPSLNKLPYHTGADCPISEDISLRVLCLPFYQTLEVQDVERICGLMLDAHNTFEMR